ncbi:MAG: hypothetical protein H6Q04_2437 [Acidobacteria bacterium]|nr:hypothetical protein [Acidobacteriota bacterium]
MNDPVWDVAFPRIAVGIPAGQMNVIFGYKVKAAKTAVRESSPKQKQSKPGKSPLVQNR